MLLKVVPLIWVLMSILFLLSHIHKCNIAMLHHSLGGEVIFFSLQRFIWGKTLFNKLWPLLDSRAKLDFRLKKSFLFLVSLQPHELTKNTKQNKKYGDYINLVICVFLLINFAAIVISYSSVWRATKSWSEYATNELKSKKLIR